MKSAIPLILALLSHTLPVHAEQAVSVRQEIYKQVGDLQLTSQVQELEKDRARKRPAIVLSPIPATWMENLGDLSLSVA
tara:strand:+ start:371 stop:607 length:237 start_codon:yes stop_codon:yes gene_type:complete